MDQRDCDCDEPVPTEGQTDTHHDPEGTWQGSNCKNCGGDICREAEPIEWQDWMHGEVP